MARAPLGVEQRQQDADAEPRQKRQVVGRQAADRGRRRLQPHGRPPGQDDGPDRPHRRGQQRRVDQGQGRREGRDQAQDRRLAIHPGDPEPAVRRPEAHLVQGEGRGDVHEPEARRVRTLQSCRALHDAGLRPEQEPALLAGRDAEGRVPRVRPGNVERRRAGADPERPGRLDAQLRPERRKGVRGERPEALPLVLLESRLPDLARLRRHAVSVQHRRVPQGAQPRDRSQLGLEARRVRLRAAGRRDRPERSLPAMGDRQVGEGAGEADGDVQPDRGQEAADRQRVHLQGQQPDRSERKCGQARHPRHLGLVGLGRLEPDHHEELPGDRDRLEREARAVLGRLVPERVLDEEPDTPLAGRITRLRLRLLLREPVAKRVHPLGDGREPDRELGALCERQSNDAPQQVEGDARREEATSDRHAAGEALAAGSGQPAGGLRSARRSRLGASTCAGSPVASSSTSSQSGSR